MTASRLTPALTAEINALVAQGVHLSEIARRVDTDRNNLRNWTRRGLINPCVAAPYVKASFIPTEGRLVRGARQEHDVFVPRCPERLGALLAIYREHGLDDTPEVALWGQQLRALSMRVERRAA